MTIATSGPLKGFCPPDYTGNGVVNMLSSVIRSRGGRSPHAELEGLPASLLRPARNVIYLVADGLGEEQLARLLRAGHGRKFFAAHLRRAISTVFPATTAAAVTTFATGASPAEHGILGWHLHLPDLGMVSTILPATTRTGSAMAPPEFDLHRYLKLPSYLDTTRGRRALLSFGHIPESRYSKTGTRWHERAGYKTLKGMVRAVSSFARRSRFGLAYAYWPGFDSVCHEKGCFHAATVRHMNEIDRALARLVSALKGTNTCLLVTADHGLVDAPRSRCVELREVPGFMECLALLPSGDAREVSCFVRPARLAQFKKIVNRHLRKACICVRGEELLRLGVFGPGRQHAALSSRLGDYVLLARDGYAFASTPAGAESDFNVGNHGGMSKTEVRVPLYVVHC
ncbi:MAG TPA: alkaline phosphatase family protein [Kiritimatiellia bacterium]|nr:alkaline phosphatase family protein [Kiritimatiellia bacterium]